MFVCLVQERSSFVQEGSFRRLARSNASTPDVPRLRNLRGPPSFDAGTNVVPTVLGRNPDELENSEDFGSAGGLGNQHVRLRGAKVNESTRSARLHTLPC